MSDFEKPIVTVDIVPLTIHQDRLKALVIMRDKAPSIAIRR